MENTTHWCIYGKRKTDKRYSLLDYKDGRFVRNRIYGTFWNDTEKDHVKNLVNNLNLENPDYIFEVRKW